MKPNIGSKLIGDEIGDREKSIRRPFTGAEKGFDPTLFDCIDNALISILGKEAVLVFYYVIGEQYHLAEKEFERKPLELLQHLEGILGVGYVIVENAIKEGIRKTFQV